MRKDRGDVWLVPSPPLAVLRAMNVVTRPLLRSRLGKRFGGVMLLTFRGRHTGRVITVPVNYHLVDGVPMAFTDSGWRHNFAGGVPVRVTHRGEAHETTGTLVPMDPAAMGVAIRKSLDTGASAQRMGIRTAKNHEPTAAELAALGPELGTSVIELAFRPGPARI
jgi:hypothetical protein